MLVSWIGKRSEPEPNQKKSNYSDRRKGESGKGGGFFQAVRVRKGWIVVLLRLRGLAGRGRDGEIARLIPGWKMRL